MKKIDVPAGPVGDYIVATMRADRIADVRKGGVVQDDAEAFMAYDPEGFRLAVTGPYTAKDGTIYAAISTSSPDTDHVEAFLVGQDVALQVASAIVKRAGNGAV